MGAVARRRCGLAVLVGAGLLAACSSGATRSAPTPEATLPLGLPVPVGARLLGPPILAPARVLDVPAGWPTHEALLRVDGDPRRVWDRLRRTFAGSGVRLDASEIACVDDHEANGLPVGAVACHSSNFDSRDESTPEVHAQLTDDGREASLALTVSTPPTTTGSTTFPAGPSTTSVQQLDADERAVDGRRARTSERRFLEGNNCFDSGSSFHVPPGAHLVGVGRNLLDGDLAVLQVDRSRRVRDVLDQLGAQLVSGDGARVDGFAVPRRRVVPGGHPVWFVDHGVSAGGGYCWAWASQDGRHVMIGAYSD